MNAYVREKKIVACMVYYNVYYIMYTEVSNNYYLAG